jgi:hypothetical protein
MDNARDLLMPNIYELDGELIEQDGNVVECEECPCVEVDCGVTCCNSGSLTPTMEVDLGANPLTDEECDACDTVTGVFEINNTGTCVWSGEFDYECSAEGTVNCFPPNPAKTYNGFRLVINAELFQGANCLLRVTVSMLYLKDGVQVTSDDSCSGAGGAYWDSALNDIECDGSLMTLTKGFSDIGGTACVDNTPATITARFV